MATFYASKTGEVSAREKEHSALVRELAGECMTLLENDVNILGSVNNDSAEYGIVRMVVSDPDKAEQALQAAGYMTRQTDVLGVEVVDQPGNLNSLLKTLLETNIDIDYIYLSFNRESGCPIMVFHVPDVYETEASLKSKGYTVL